ncbi:MAG: hypothetical protein L0312_06045, partial [Acidobacteria bacterium]|nr:hypothetical protein [Acidobacteriota bacterium]
MLPLAQAINQFDTLGNALAEYMLVLVCSAALKDLCSAPLGAVQRSLYKFRRDFLGIVET